ncbi:MAG: HIT domain-containing protein, partial [Gammaproteobacteria bacterium]|nr:HIT domain-containing protein [Gammaproteobacteria bacterium]
MTDCLFCKMVSGEIQPDVVLETDDILAFRDLSPQAPTHILIIPKKHISTINDIHESDAEVMGKLYLAAKEIAANEGLAEP